MDKLPAALVSLALLAAATGCGNRDRDREQGGVAQTGFPGQITAGGSSSGEVMARSARSATEGGNARGTPGIPQGSEGNVGGAAMGGTTGGKSTPASGTGQ